MGKLDIIALVFFCLLSAYSGPWAQDQCTFMFKGMVVDSVDHEPIPGAIVTSGIHGAVSLPDGTFSLLLPCGNHGFSCSQMGYATAVLSAKDYSKGTIQVTFNLKKKSEEMDLLVVSASKHQQRLEDVTVSMEVLQPKLLQNKNITSLDEGLQQTPGVVIVDEEPQIRSGSGYSFGAGSRVQVLLDNMPILSGDAGKVSWGYLPMENVSQVEIIKGASSVLYGSAALSGVIHFRTRYATNQPYTHLQLWQGWYDMPTTPSYNWSGTPIKSGVFFTHTEKINRLELNLGVAVMGDDGHMAPATDTLGNPLLVDKNPFTVDRWNAQNRNRMNLGLRYASQRIKGLYVGVNSLLSQSESYTTLIWANQASGLYDCYPGAYSQTKQILFNIDPFVEYNNGQGATHTLRNRWQSLDNNNNSNQGNFSDVFYSEYQYQQDWTNWHVPGVITTLGAVNQYTDARGKLYIGGNPDGTNTAQNQSAYLQVDGSFLNNKLKYSVGARYEHFRINETNEGKPVFRTGLNYTLGQATFLRASYGQGYRFPSIAEKFIVTGLGAIKIYPNPDLKSETSENLEFGIKQGFKIRSFKGFVDLSVFQQNFNNFIEFTFGQWAAVPTVDNMIGIGFKSLNTGTARVQGAEFSIMGTGEILPETHMTVLAGYTYTLPVSTSKDYVYAKSDSVNAFYLPPLAQCSYTSTSSNSNNGILKYRMQHLVRADLSVQRKHWDAGVSFRYNSHMQNMDQAFEDLESSFPTLFNPGIHDWREQHTQGDYVFDTRAAYVWDKHRLGIAVNNVLNRIYSIRPLVIEEPRTFVVQYSLTI